MTTRLAGQNAVIYPMFGAVLSGDVQVGCPNEFERIRTRTDYRGRRLRDILWEGCPLFSETH